MATATKNDSNGRHLLTEADFVAVVDGADNEVGAIPKHWDSDQLADGLEKTTRKPSGGESKQAPAPADPAPEVIEEAVAKAVAEREAKIAELQKQLAEAAKK